jgi:hypothetical protein
MQEHFSFLVPPYLHTHAHTHIVHLKHIQQDKGIKKQIHMDNKTKVTNTTHIDPKK